MENTIVSVDSSVSSVVASDETAQDMGALEFLSVLSHLVSLDGIVNDFAGVSEETIDSLGKLANKRRRYNAKIAGEKAHAGEGDALYQARKLFSANENDILFVMFTDTTMGTFVVVDRKAEKGRNGNSSVTIARQDKPSDMRTLNMREHAATIQTTKVLLKHVVTAKSA